MLKDYEKICMEIREEQALQNLWQNYIKVNVYAAYLKYDDLVTNVLEVGKFIESHAATKKLI